MKQKDFSFSKAKDGRGDIEWRNYVIVLFV
jgi:hypothetical protein